MSDLDFDALREAMERAELDGWLLWDFQGRNPIALRALGFDQSFLTRRVAYWIPRRGNPTLLAHRVEARSLPAVPGELVAYSSREEWSRALAKCLAGQRRIAMEYVPGGEIPYLSSVDAGSIEFVRSLGPEVVSSAALVQDFLCRLSRSQIESHQRAALAIDAAKDGAFAWIGEGILAGRPASEFEVQQWLMARFAEAGLVTNHAPVVAVGANAGNPHYLPTPEASRPCARDELVLIDLWAKERGPEAVYADVTWMGYAGDEVPPRLREVFEVVRDARDLGLETLSRAHESGRELQGWEVDRSVRDFIAERGFGDAFVHRTGHNIGTAVHGDGANLDDLETHDTRPLVRGLCFSIEPGIYLPDFGVRSEIDVVLEAEGPQVYTPIQREFFRIAT